VELANASSPHSGTQTIVLRNRPTTTIANRIERSAWLCCETIPISQ